MIPITINRLNQGTIFHMTASETSHMWVKGEYNRFAKKWECHKYDDVNHEKLLGKNRVVYISEGTPHKK